VNDFRIAAASLYKHSFGVGQLLCQTVAHGARIVSTPFFDTTRTSPYTSVIF
jgi:hypothetical protein